MKKYNEFDLYDYEELELEPLNEGSKEITATACIIVGLGSIGVILANKNDAKEVSEEVAPQMAKVVQQATGEKVEKIQINKKGDLCFYISNFTPKKALEWNKDHGHNMAGKLLDKCDPFVRTEFYLKLAKGCAEKMSDEAAEYFASLWDKDSHKEISEEMPLDDDDNNVKQDSKTSEMIATTNIPAEIKEEIDDIPVTIKVKTKDGKYIDPKNYGLNKLLDQNKDKLDWDSQKKIGPAMKGANYKGSPYEEGLYDLEGEPVNEGFKEAVASGIILAVASIGLGGVFASIEKNKENKELKRQNRELRQKAIARAAAKAAAEDMKKKGANIKGVEYDPDTESVNLYFATTPKKAKEIKKDLEKEQGVIKLNNLSSELKKNPVVQDAIGKADVVVEVIDSGNGREQSLDDIDLYNIEKEIDIEADKGMNFEQAQDFLERLVKNNWSEAIKYIKANPEYVSKIDEALSSTEVGDDILTRINNYTIDDKIESIIVKGIEEWLYKGLEKKLDELTDNGDIEDNVDIENNVDIMIAAERSIEHGYMTYWIRKIVKEKNLVNRLIRSMDIDEHYKIDPKKKK